MCGRLASSTAHAPAVVYSHSMQMHASASIMRMQPYVGASVAIKDLHVLGALRTATLSVLEVRTCK